MFTSFLNRPELDLNQVILNGGVEKKFLKFPGIVTYFYYFGSYFKKIRNPEENL